MREFVSTLCAGWRPRLEMRGSYVSRSRTKEKRRNWGQTERMHAQTPSGVLTATQTETERTKPQGDGHLGNSLTLACCSIEATAGCMFSSAGRLERLWERRRFPFPAGSVYLDRVPPDEDDPPEPPAGDERRRDAERLPVTSPRALSWLDIMELASAEVMPSRLRDEGEWGVRAMGAWRVISKIGPHAAKTTGGGRES